MSIQSNQEHEIRRVQALQNERSLVLVLPKSMAMALGLKKGSYLKCRLDKGTIVLEKNE